MQIKQTHMARCQLTQVHIYLHAAAGFHDGNGLQELRV